MSIPFRQLTSAAGCHRENECSLWKGWQLYRRGLMKRVSSTRDLWLSFWTTWRYRTQAFMFRSHRGATRKNGCAFQNLFEGKQKELTRGCCCIYVWESCFWEFLTGFKHFSALRGKGNMHHIVLECMTWFFFLIKGNIIAACCSNYVQQQPTSFWFLCINSKCTVICPVPPRWLLNVTVNTCLYPAVCSKESNKSLVEETF